jgi:hypothetical protein
VPGVARVELVRHAPLVERQPLPGTQHTVDLLVATNLMCIGSEIVREMKQSLHSFS